MPGAAAFHSNSPVANFGSRTAALGFFRFLYLNFLPRRKGRKALEVGRACLPHY